MTVVHPMIRTAGFKQPDGIAFQVLGPLEVTRGGVPVPLRGIQQRAVLGSLLLHANAVVATSELTRALWRENPPATARKMLQNAVAGVRAILGNERKSQVALVTQAPGYLLRVPPERVDLLRFQRLATMGRMRLIERDWDEASTILREALSLWRGRLLADLAEAGFAWPELAVEQNVRLAVLEDYAEAQLALNRHHDVINQLEPVLTMDGQPPRERLAGSLMIALYRAGRQADALSVYRRTRGALIDQLGLDPSRELQELERSILAHDPALMAPASVQEVAPPVLNPAQEAAVLVPQQRRREPTLPYPREPAVPASSLRLAPAAAPVSEVLAAERKPMTVLLLRAGTDGAGDDYDPEDLQEAWELLDHTIERVVARFGGSVRRESLGSLWTVWFGVPRTQDDDANRAIEAGMELLMRLTPAGHDGSQGGLVVRLAVASGDALVTRPGPDHQVEVSGGLLDTALRLLSEVPAGELRVCDITKDVSDFMFSRGECGAGWAVTGTHPEDRGLPQVDLVEGAEKLHLLRRILGDVRRQRRAQLATVVGEPGIGKSRLVTEFCRLAAQPDPSLPETAQVRCVVTKVGGSGAEGIRAVLQDVIRSLLGQPDRPAQPDSGTLRLTSSDPDGAICGTSRQLIERIAAKQPLVIVFEDLHRADDWLLDYVEDLIHHAASLPLFIVVTARPELSERRPYWGGGSSAATMLTLDPLTDAGMRRLLRLLWQREFGMGEAPQGIPAGEETEPAEEDERFDARVLSRIGGNPRFAVEYVRHLAAASDPHDSATGDLRLPSAVVRVIAARIDAIPPVEKAILQDAAVLGSVVCTMGVAAISGRDPDEVAHRLRLLESRELLRRVAGRQVDETFGQVYVFRHATVRDVAYAQLPRGVRADKHSRAAAWLRDGTTGSEEMVALHSDAANAAVQSRAVPLSPVLAANEPVELATAIRSHH